MAFLRNLTTGETRRAVLNAASDQAKDDSAQLIRHLAAIYEADLVFTIMDACGLPRDKVRRRREIVQHYGSIGASPYRIDFVSFALESRHGIWGAQVPIKPKGISKKLRTFGINEFRLCTEAAGRLVGLPPTEGTEGPGTGGPHLPATPSSDRQTSVPLTDIPAQAAQIHPQGPAHPDRVLRPFHLAETGGRPEPAQIGPRVGRKAEAFAASDAFLLG